MRIENGRNRPEEFKDVVDRMQSVDDLLEPDKRSVFEYVDESQWLQLELWRNVSVLKKFEHYKSLFDKVN